MSEDTSTDTEALAIDAMGAMYVDLFTSAYIETALWSEPAYIDVADDGTVTMAPDSDISFSRHNFSEDDLTSEAHDAIRADCVDFIASNYADLQAIAKAGYASQSGHDFWLTRNGHGAGFWDRGYGAAGDRLTDASHSYGETHLYILTRNEDAWVDGVLPSIDAVTIGIE